MKTIPPAIRIILADDHELFRDGFGVMIKKQPEVDLIAEAKDGEELLRRVEEHGPDVVVTDIKMPKVDGLEVMKRMKKEFPHIGVIALTSFDEENLLVDMLEAGAKGYLLKSAHKEEIVEAIITVYQGKTYHCEQTSAKLAQLIARSSFPLHRKQNKVTFNEREQQIIPLICEGNTNKEIGSKLFLGKRTVETHREHILEKMDVKNTAGVVIYAIRHGLYKI